MSVVDSQSLEIWVQSGIPEDGELVFNVHFRNSRNVEWEFGALDIDINKRTDALRDVAFPTLSKEAAVAFTSNTKYKNKMKDLEHCRMSLEQWVFYIVTRIEVVPDDLRDSIEAFFYLPGGPDDSTHDDLSAPLSPGVGEGTQIASLASLQVNPNLLPDGNGDYDDAASEVTIGSVDENGVLKKKKKRILKGAKRRLSNVLGVDLVRSKKEQFSVDTAGMEESKSPKLATSPSVISSSSFYSTSDGRLSAGDRTPGEVQSVQPGKLIKVRVIRGGERSRGVPEYEIQLVYNPEKRPYTATHVYSDFADLKEAVDTANGVGVGATFPVSHLKNSLGMALSEEQQAERTRLLDAWTKDLVSTYQYMNDKERMLVRTFLNLDLSIQKDIFLQDKMANGMVEAPRAPVTGIASPACSKSGTPSKSVSGNRSESGSSRVSGGKDDAVSQISGYSATTSRSGRPPMGRRSSTGVVGTKSPSERRAGYRVKIASTGSLGDTKAQPLRQKLDLKDMDGTVFTDENSVDAQPNMFPGRAKQGGGRLRADSVERLGSRPLSHIPEEDDTASKPEGMLEENLLRIGMKEKKPKKECCVVM